MASLSRREFVSLSIVASAWTAHGAGNDVLCAADVPNDNAPKSNIDQQLLELAAQQERERRAAFVAVNDRESLGRLQGSLRETFLRLIGGLPQTTGAPAGDEDWRDRRSGLHDREARVRELSGLFRFGAAV